MKSVKVENVQKTYGAMHAVKDVSFEVGEGEFVSLLGPSGCGKTTTLRMIAGLITPDSGRIQIGQQDVVSLPTYKRDIGMVFQNYALFPHMTVAENIGFGLRMRNLNASEIKQKVSVALDLIHLPHIADRYPKQLSGGQQQRVALARAIAIKPDLLLLDEPLSNLDLKMRMQMRVELKQLQQKLGITSIFVTHDQGEGLNMSDRVVVMDRGTIAQIGTPKDIYENPANAFVAGFIGEATLVSGQVVSQAERLVIVRSDAGMEMPVYYEGTLKRDQQVWLSLRPEKLSIHSFDHATAGHHVRFSGRVEHVAYNGASVKYLVKMENGDVLSVDQPSQLHKVDEIVTLGWKPEDARLLQN